MHRMLTGLIGLACVSTIFATQQPNLSNLNPNVKVDYDTISFTKAGSNDLKKFHIEGLYASTGRPYSGYVATFAANYFSFYPAVKEGCVLLIKTSESSSSTYDCDYATNGAFFTWDISTTGSLCLGNLVSDSKTWQLPTDGSGTGRANFGITEDGKIFTGFIDSSVIKSNKFSQLITGYGWLVRHGQSNVNASQDLSFQPGGFTLEKAPRTAVGSFANGTMLLLEVDGEEDILAGPDLFEMAELLVALGVDSAVNIDGGGSSVSTAKGAVISQPTCNDTPEICERAVANIACVRA